jgi:integrase
MRGLYQRGDVWWFDYSIEGQRKRVSCGTKDEAEAIQFARGLLDKPKVVMAHVWPQEVNDYLAARIAAREMSTNAADSRRTVLLRFGKDYGVCVPGDVTSQLIERFYRTQQNEIAEVTVQTYVRWIYTFLSYLCEKGKILRAPKPIELDKVRKTKRKPFCSREQVRAIIQSAPTQDLRFVLYCGFHCGMRREEISEARPEWFDMRNGLVHIQRSDTWEPKDRDDRTVPLTQEFADFLTHSYGFPSPFMVEPSKLAKKKWRYRYDFRRPFENLMEQLKVEWVTPHTMRRTFASLKVSAGVSLYKVAIWLGDLERVVQDHYGYLIPKDSDIERGL